MQISDQGVKRDISERSVQSKSHNGLSSWRERDIRHFEKVLNHKGEQQKQDSGGDFKESSSQGGSVRNSVSYSNTPDYTQAQADRDAAALYEATRGGLTGLGTDEDKIFKTLEGKRQADIERIRQSFKDHYGKDLDKVINGEMGGVDLKRAQALLKSNASQSDAVVIQDELDDLFVSSEKILTTLEKQSPAQRRAMAQAFARMNGGTRAGQSAQAFMLSKLEKNLDGSELARARNLLRASQTKSPEMAAAFEIQALKDGLKNDMDGLGTDEKRIFERLEKSTAAQRQALLKDQGVLNQLKGELSTNQFERAMGILQGNSSRADAARVREAMSGFFGADERAVRNILKGKTPEALSALKVEYQKQTGRCLEDEVRKWGGIEAQVTLRMLNPLQQGDQQAQAQASAERMRLAMAGAGTDEDALRHELNGKSKTDIDAISAAYQQKYGKDLRAELDAELDGRDEFEILKQTYDCGAIDPNDPNAAQKRVQRLREQQAYEKSLGTLMLDGVQRLIKGESDNDRLSRNLERAESAIQSGNLHKAQTLTGYAADDVKSLQSSKDAVADAAATVAVIGATTAAVVATGGAATPLAIAGYAAAGATTRAVTYAAMQGDAAGAQELGRQGLIGLAEGGTAVLPVGKGLGAATSGARTAATTALRETAENSVKTAAWQGLKEGALGGAAGGTVDAATRSETWDNGVLEGLSQVGGRAVTDGALGAATGGLVGGATAKGKQLLQGVHSLGGEAGVEKVGSLGTDRVDVPEPHSKAITEGHQNLQALKNQSQIEPRQTRAIHNVDDIEKLEYITGIGKSGPKGARGPVSGREFDPSNAGGRILNLNTNRIKVTSKGVDVVERHISRFGPDEANEIMIKRLRDIQAGKIKATQTDLNFYSHELRESVRYKKLGWRSGQPSNADEAYDLWNNAHTATLEDYGLKEGPGVLYHPSAMRGQ